MWKRVIYLSEVHELLGRIEEGRNSDRGILTRGKNLKKWSRKITLVPECEESAWQRKRMREYVSSSFPEPEMKYLAAYTYWYLSLRSSE